MLTTIQKLYPFFLLIILLVSCDKTETEKGMSLYENGKYEEAIAMFDAYLKKHPKDANTYFNKGRALEQQGKLEAALDSYQEAIDADNSQEKFWIASGMCNYKMKKFDNTVSNMDGLLEIQPKNGAAKVLKARAFAQMQKIRSAMETLNLAIKENQRNGEAYLYRGYIRAIARDVNACDDLEQAKRLKIRKAQEFLNKYCE